MYYLCRMMQSIKVKLSYINRYEQEVNIFHYVSLEAVKNNPEILRTVVEFCERQLKYDYLISNGTSENEEYTPMPIVPCC